MGKESGLEPDFFEWWFSKNSEVPGYFSEDQHAKAITLFYEQARDLGVLKSYPDIRTLVWDKAPRAWRQAACRPRSARSGLAPARAAAAPGRAGLHAGLPGRLGSARSHGCCRPFAARARAKWRWALLRFLVNRTSCGTWRCRSATLGAIALSFVIGALLALLPVLLSIWRFAIQHRLAPLLNAFPGVGWTLLAVMWFGINSGAVIFAIKRGT